MEKYPFSKRQAAIHFQYHKKQYILYGTWDGAVGYFLVDGLWSEEEQSYLPKDPNQYRTGMDAEIAAYKQIDLWLEARNATDGANSG
jgi:hypothetical protein